MRREGPALAETMRARPLALAACLLLASCDRAPKVDRHTAPPSSATAPKPSPPAPLVDLFYRTKARVAVSSNVQNPKDYPEHLIDRRPETAWNGKTGDLGAKVLFHVPERTRVKRISIIVGYDRFNKDGDLFFMNHRVEQLTISREGVVVGTFDLDPDDRKPQTIDLDLPGGSFELRAEKTKPGTKTAWREIVISELAVLGTSPDDELIAPSMPRVTIGTLHRPPSEPGPFAAVRAEAPFAAIEAFCGRHMVVEEEVRRRILREHPGIHVEELKPYCDRAGDRAPERVRLAQPFEEVATLNLVEGAEMVRRLAIRTERGWYPTNVTFSMEYPGPGCGLFGGYGIDSAMVETPSGGKSVLVLKVTKSAAYQMGGPESFEVAAEFFIACTLDATGAPVCEEELTASFEGDGSWTYEMRNSQQWTHHPPRWDWQRDASVDGDGHIRLSPCVGPTGPLRSCGRRNADLLRNF